MRIEGITKEKIESIGKKELHVLRTRFTQQWEKYFKGKRIEQVGSLTRDDFIEKYKIVKREMILRNLIKEDEALLDIDKYIIAKNFFNFFTSDFGELVVVPDYVSFAGSFVRNPKAASDLDVVLRTPSHNRDPSFELKLSRTFAKSINKSTHFIYHPTGPHSTFIPVFDLVLRPKSITEKVEVKEDYQKAQYTCKFCQKTADWVYLWADGRAFIPVCSKHKEKAKKQIEVTNKDKITAIRSAKTFKKKAAIEAEDEINLEYSYYRQLDQWDENRISDFAAVVKELAPGSILELGCGTGKFLKLLNNGGRTVFGIDNSEVALSMAKGHGIEVMQKDLEEDLPFNSNSFDNVAVVHTLEHLEKPETLISEAQRVAKEKVIIVTPLGKRFCAEHKQEFKTIEDYKKLFAEKEWRIEPLQYYSALAVYDKPERLKKTALKPLQRFKPTKFAPSTGYAESEFFNIEKWAEWAEKYLKEGGVGLEMKYNGYHAVLELDANNKPLIYFEDSMRDRSSVMPEVVSDLKAIGKTVIIDADIGMRSKKGELLPRVDLALLAATKSPIEGWYKIPGREAPEAKLEVHVYDLLYYDGRDIHDLPFHERREFMKKMFGATDFKTFKLSPVHVVKDKAGFISTAKKLSALQGSEGAVAKWMNFKYPIYPKTTPAISKYKKNLEIKVRVMGIARTKTPGTVNLEIGYGEGTAIILAGKTFNTKLKAKVGDIVTITVDEVIPIKEKEGWRLGFVSPRVQDLETARAKPEQRSSIVSRANQKGILQANEEMRRLLGIKKSDSDILRTLEKERAKEGTVGEFGNLDFKLGDKGEGVLQLHIMGIEEDKVAALEKASNKIRVAKLDLRKLQSFLLSLIGEQGAHLDMRLRPTKAGYWEGGEFMIGNLSGLKKLGSYQKGRKLRFGWKQSRVGEKKTEVVRGPLSWLGIGDRKVEIFAPGEVGSTAKMHSAMILIDKLKWEIYQADEHAKKFKFENKFLNGNWLFAFVPTTPEGKKGARIWMASKLKNEDYEETIEAARKAIKKIIEEDVFDDEKLVPIFKIDEDEQIVGGIVYEPGAIDAHEDFSTAEEIRLACYDFMEKIKKFKLAHEGEPLDDKVRILENYIAPVDFEINKQKVKKGSWVLVVRINDDKIWKLVKSGKITGFSMGGRAKRRRVRSVKS